MSRKKVIVLFFLVLLSGCSKKLLDLSAGNYALSELLNSKNCDSKCWQQAACEGEMVSVYAYLDQDNIDKEQKSFVLDGMRGGIQVFVADSILDEVFEKLNANSNKMFLVKGIITGYDAPSNFVCERRFSMKINRAEDVSVYYSD